MTTAEAKLPMTRKTIWKLSNHYDHHHHIGLYVKQKLR
jgi:hypothetical protein